jgi:AraC family transcriptional regulator of adaptative response/methylated-DNA-[protein]-cysteine methyltransferase
MKLRCFRSKNVFLSRQAKFTWGQSRSCLGNVYMIWRNDALAGLGFYNDKKELLKTLAGFGLENKSPSQNQIVESFVTALTNQKLLKRYTRELTLTLFATEFQERVWKRLLQIPWGTTCTYMEIAQYIGKASAARAVGRACGSNPIAILIPCHRVISSNSNQSHYRWGSWRKRYLLQLESKAPLMFL